MNVDFIIVGQGIAGTLLSFELLSRGYSLVVIDEKQCDSASIVAGAVLNPVVFKGRKNDDKRFDRIRIAVDYYKRLGDLLDIVIINETSLIRFASSGDELFKLEKAVREAGLEKNTQLHHEKEIDSFFFNAHGYASVSPVWKIDNGLLLEAWRSFLREKSLLVEAYFDYDDCKFGDDSLQYKNLNAKKIIFCEGTGVRANPFINTASFVKNRGDVLLIRVPGAATGNIFQKEFRLIPLREDLFWYGSNYRWRFDNLDPDPVWRKHAEQSLHSWLKLPFTVEAHLVAERPTTAGQQVFASRTDNQRNAWWLNGLGTKGFTVAPSIIQSLLPQLLQ